MSDETSGPLSNPGPPEPTQELTEDQRVGHYIAMWKQAVEVQQHFNEIEWRIRGLALTVATFALGAAGLAVRDQTQVGPLSLGALIVAVGLVLWYAFYFVDRAWYHPMLEAAVSAGTKMEVEIRKSLPEAGLTSGITAGSPFKPGWLVQFLSGNKGEMHSRDKLAWFYKVGAAALILVVVGLQIAACISDPPDQRAPTVVVEQGGPGR